jgi:hypothetical protein
MDHDVKAAKAFLKAYKMGLSPELFSGLHWELTKVARERLGQNQIWLRIWLLTKI